MDCGPTCIRMVAKHYGRQYNANTLRRIAGYNKQGVSLLGISETAEKIGFRTRGVKLTFEQLKEATLPAILHWNQNHFVVLLSLSGRRGSRRVRLADPAKGIITYTKDDFKNHWLSSENENNEPVGIQEHEIIPKIILQHCKSYICRQIDITDMVFNTRSL